METGSKRLRRPGEATPPRPTAFAPCLWNYAMGAAAGRARRIFHTARPPKRFDIPLTRFYERLDRARERLALHLCAGDEIERDSAWRGAPYLRVIK